MTPNQLLADLGVPPASGTLLNIAVHLERHQDTLAAAAGLTAMPPPLPVTVAAQTLTEQLIRYYRR